jgi:hypothetical protein
MTQFKIDFSDRNTPLWSKLSRYFEGRVDELHIKLEGDISEVQAAKLRGRIAEIRACMALDKVPAALE